jgi:succinate-semialdehyde dehydrogenase/glutarate-semialdehyde dehydrogenase
VLGLVFGNPSEISEYLIASPIIRKITFTGSTPVGKLLAGLAGQHMKRVSMELGGHAPVIVAEDADIDLAVKSVGTAKFRNAGQVCISPTRFLVHNSVKDEFAQALAAYASSIRVGDGTAQGVQMGPLANPRRLAAMAEFQQDAVEKGATLLAGGNRIGETGNFWQPTVLTDVPLEARLFNDEPFGPVAGVRGFDHLDEAISEANRLSFGLAGYAFTRSLAHADLLTRRVEVGMLWVNTPATPSAELPFGGLKDSGTVRKAGRRRSTITSTPARWWSPTCDEQGRQRRNPLAPSDRQKVGQKCMPSPSIRRLAADWPSTMARLARAGS